MITEKKPLVILTGPTSVGKTALSIHLAKAIGGEIISADSAQVYRGLDIGSAKIRQEEMEGVRHYLIDILEPEDEFNVFLFQEQVRKILEESVYPAGKIPIIAGGTGFYIQAVLYDIDFSEDPVTDYTKELEEIAKQDGGKEQLHKMLAEADPEYAAIIHPNNVLRVIRGLAHYHLTGGEKLSEHNKNQMERQSPYHYAYFVLNRNREELYRTINERVDEMFRQGLLDEVKGLKERGLTRNHPSMKGIGYKEVLDYLELNQPNENDYYDMVETIKKNTRHFAKKQLTWFRRERDVIWLDRDELVSEEDVLNTIILTCRKKGILE